MLQAFALLLLSQLSGEGITRGLGLPVPGPVIGLVLMAIGLLIAQRVDFVRTETIEETALGRTATGLLGHLSLLFVPAGVGIVQHGGALLRNGVAIAVAPLAAAAWRGGGRPPAAPAVLPGPAAGLPRAPETIA